MSAGWNKGPLPGFARGIEGYFDFAASRVGAANRMMPQPRSNAISIGWLAETRKRGRL